MNLLQNRKEVLSLFKMEDILSGDFSAYPEETQAYMKKFTEILRSHIKSELINDRADKMLKDIDKSKEYFIDVLTQILENGCKGYDNMSTRALLNTYLNVKNEEDFMNLMEKVNNEMNALE